MSRVLILMLAPFAFATGAYVFAGLLDPMAADLDVSVAAVGQLQTAFTIACAIGGPVLAILTSGWARKTLLIAVLVVLAALNALSAVVTVFEPLIMVRIAAGFLGALTLPVASAIAIGIVGPEKRAAALAAVLAGNSVAFLVGIPLGSFVGATFGWPTSFWLAAGLCAVVALLVVALIPATLAPPPPPPGAFKSVLRWPVTGLLGVTFLVFTATFSTVGFIGPVVTDLTGFTGATIGLMQALIGVGSIIGLIVGARLAGSSGRPLLGLLVIVLATQVLYSFGMHSLSGGASGLLAGVVAIAVGAAALFACAPIIQNRLAIAAGPAATLAFALNGSMIFAGQGVGTALGGITTSTFGLSWVGVAGAIIAAVGAFLASRNLMPVHAEVASTPEVQK